MTKLSKYVKKKPKDKKLTLNWLFTKWTKDHHCDFWRQVHSDGGSGKPLNVPMSVRKL